MIDAEIYGQKGHGISRVEAYSKQAIAKKVDGFATPMIRDISPNALGVNANGGFAYTAVKEGLEQLKPKVKETGIGAMVVNHSHHLGMLSHFMDSLATEGYMSLFLTNAPKAIAPYGGYKPLFGTNPIGFGAPHKGDNIIIDLSLSKVARGKIMVAQKNNETIPPDLAIDKNGNPTTNATEAMEGEYAPYRREQRVCVGLDG